MTSAGQPFQPEELAGQPEVVRWLSGAGYGPSEQAEVLESLSGFCFFVEKTPAELVSSCLRATDQGTAISGKGRRETQAAIERYVADRGLSGRSAVVVGNHIRGFLVHNGVFIQGSVSIS